MIKSPSHQGALHHRQQFISRILRNFALGSSLILGSLLLGMIGYHYFENMSWIDAYVNASMILSGMGPVSELKTTGGKIFAGTYALFSGIFFLISIAIVVAPLFHRFFHKLHFGDIQKM
ncbi:MAG: hypothetical protein ACXWM7_02375 [Parachlamydiaceae bacterium]